ncbi:hypothetical protein BCD67_03150 [Oscillatoriales cyanobacterium USR001]|nr:hypothetical protein BCD67_03150 [Oscillatoriales cyanobacterium USR001]
MDTLTNRYNRQPHPEEQLLYNHWLEQVQVEQPEELIKRFRSLFIESVGYPDREIATALEKLAASKHAEEEFKFVINRCCHILINRWHTSSAKHTAIPELISLFEGVAAKPPARYLRHQSNQRLPELIKKFAQSEQYIILRRLAKVISQGKETSNNSHSTAQSKPLGALISRYPYLYKHCLLSEGSPYEYQKTIKQIQTENQRQFEIDLSQYVAHAVRRSQMANNGNGESVGRIIQPIKNPTLLSDRELFFALKQFIGKVEGADTYRQFSQRFLSQTNYNQSYGSFKDNLYEYLITTTNGSDYGKRQFNDKLYKQLRNIIPQSESQKFSEFLMIRTCSQLLNFLVVESSQRPNHFVFLDLVSNLGATQTTGLLLKIVLICNQVKPYLEKRFAILFNHYESTTRDGVLWLVKGLENLNLALITNFGSVDLSYLR